ncbi:MAG: DUF1501 domain-containing protein [Pirellulaceae bacterium]|nr:DUF1501 domain-containing protein [Pirellulaceae bacterium]
MFRRLHSSCASGLCEPGRSSLHSRRIFLERGSLGFGAAALAALLHTPTTADDSINPGIKDMAVPQSAALPQLHHPAQAKHVIFCYMSGGVSHIDSFDPKPELQRLHGQPMPVPIRRTQFNDNGKIMASPFQFHRAGQSGIDISELFPEIAKVADELAVVRSMTTPVSEHAQGNFLMHSGFPFMGHPSAGAWCSYGLGNLNENFPSYVVLQSGGAVPPHGGVSLFSNGFLPALHQGSILNADAASAIANIRPLDSSDWQRPRLKLMQQLDQGFLASVGSSPEISSALANYETAFRMQTSVPEVCDISGETAETRALYGVDSSNPTQAGYARQCLLARRLIERGIRFIELSCLNEGIGAGNAPNPWDQHGELERGHRAMARQVDQPISGLIQDLRRIGKLDETLIVWAGEFGRTPFSQGANGRDHNPMGFSVWLAGGGIRGGSILGATDELGYYAVQNPCQVYDLWATALHLLGIDHTRLTYRYSGRDFRLTDVHGHVLTSILA